eukprot:gene7179-9789_t
MKISNLADHPLDHIWFTSLFVSWISPLIKLATTRPIREEDVWECPSSMSVDANTLRFETAWKEELKNAKIEKRNPSVKKALWIGFGNDLIVAGIFQFIFLCLQLTQPFIVGAIVHFVKTGVNGRSYGVGLAFALGGVSLSSSMALSETFYSLRVLGCRIRSSVMMSVYKHALQLTTAARFQNTVGQTTNLVAIDSEKFFLAVQFINFLWHGPLMSIIVMLILISEVGYAPALAGLGWFLILIPSQNYLAAQIGMIRRTMIKFTDERVKLINEILQSIRVIKVYAWEVPMENRVLQTRNDELKLLHKYLNKSAQLRELLFSAQSVAALVIILTSVYGCNRPLTLVQTFRMLAFLNITRFPLNLLGQALKTYKDGEVSLARLNKFFMLPVLHIPENRFTGESKILIKNASFSWEEITIMTNTTTIKTYGNHDKKSNPSYQIINQNDESKNNSYQNNDENNSDNNKNYNNNDNNNNDMGNGGGTDELSNDINLIKFDNLKQNQIIQNNNDNDNNNNNENYLFHLKNINFESMKSNELVAVIGAVGSGKSSFISALLNEMILLSGSSEVHGNISYCAQTPWIQNMSLQDNILFGTDFNDKNSNDSQINYNRYQRAIKAAALIPDIQILPFGEKTE